MNELITIQVTDEGDQAVSARELHEGLGIKKDFTDWFKQQVERIGLVEGRDFTPFEGKSTGGRPSTEYVVTLDIAKHLCMISGGEKAHQIREYFIQVEKAWNSPEQIMARAIQIAQKRIDNLQLVIDQQKPLVMFAETCIASNDSLLVREVAKLASKKGISIGEKRLWQRLREWGVVNSKNEPYQHAMDAGWFEIRQGTYSTPYGTDTYRTPKVTPKGQIYIIEKLKKEVRELANAR